jgi:YidC/Oxa1 family membrane protein insertase
MDEKRLIIAIVLSVLVFVIWQFFFVDKEAIKKSAQKQPTTPVTKEAPVSETPYVKDKEKPAVTEKSVTPVDVERPQKIAKTITVETPLYRVKISEQGAVFNSYVLKDYREKVEKNSALKELLTADSSLETVKLGFSGKSIPDLDKAVYLTEPNLDTLTVSESPQKLRFYWESNHGIKIEKIFNFSPDTYLIGFVVNIKNGSDQTIQDQLTLALRGAVPKETRMYGFEGPSALINNKVEEIKIKKIEEQSTYNGNLKWIAIQDRYFMSSIISQNGEEASMKLSLNPTDIIEAQYVQPEKIIRPGTQQQFDYYLFFGPKSMRVLGNAGHDLKEAVNFGWFHIIAKYCLLLMNFLYDIIPNYGVAIIILTVLIKIILWPLGSKSYKSMSEMKKIQPLMKEIREKYKDDKKKMNQEVMALYKTYKINPLGGCLPMVVQIPVFFALYRMLYQAIELRHAPFFLWINDLSAPDRLFRFGFSIPFMEPPYGIPVLTLVMGATMLLQQKMSPPMGDPTQAKMMMLMPIVFTVIFINFSSGLVLYWLVNNILSISQQYYIQKKFA